MYKNSSMPYASQESLRAISSIHPSSLLNALNNIINENIFNLKVDKNIPF